MDTRLIVTVPTVAYFVILGVFGLAQATVDVTFTEGQPAVIALLGVLGPLLAFGLIWLENYVYGAPLFIATLLPNAWFVGYFFLFHDNASNALAVSGSGSTAYLTAVIGVISSLILLAGIAF